MDLVLVNLPPWAQENPHIGVGYICAFLKDKGIKIKLIDLNKRFFLNYPDFQMLWHVENKNFWSNKDSFFMVREIFKSEIENSIGEISALNPTVVGFSVVDPKERITIDFIKRIKKKIPQTKIILGGPATSTKEQRKIFLDNVGDLVDVFVLGEGEEPCFKVVDRFRKNQKLNSIPGTIIKNKDRWRETLPDFKNDVNKIPFPKYEEFEMNQYGNSLLLEWSRGCYNRCSFCKNWRLFPRYRVKKPFKILEEIKYHLNSYNIRYFTIVDSLINGDPENLYEVCRIIRKNNLDIKWTGQIAPHRKMDYNFFVNMRKAGCFKLQIGVESGSDKVLKTMGKMYTAELSEKTVRNAKKAGIETEIFIIIGFPGEDESAFKKTFDFIKRNRAYIDTIKSINTLHLVAGTEVYERSQDFNMKPLPDKQWHFLWETYDGNNYVIRKKRAERLLELAETLGIKVMEANIREGKEEEAKKAMLACNDRRELREIFKNEINKLQALPEKRSKQKRKRSIVKWIFLLILYFYTLSYIIYFWIYMCLHGKVLLGGEVKKRR
jgi:radical SAM superfamily enzyme YgiQ (UPF0313 family)